MQETRDLLLEDTFHEAEFTKSKTTLMEDFDSYSCEEPYTQNLSESSEDGEPEFDVLSDNVSKTVSFFIQSLMKTVERTLQLDYYQRHSCLGFNNTVANSSYRDHTSV